MRLNFLSWSALLVPVLLLPGCNTLPATQAGTDGANGAAAASIVDLAGVSSGDNNIIATKSSTTDEWEFTVRTRRSLVDDLTYEWNFGDSAVHVGKVQRSTFSGLGVYPVSVLARDPAGVAVFALTLDLEVLAGNQRPVASAGADQTAVDNQLIFLYGGGTFDPDEGNLSFLWTQTSGPAVELLESTNATARFVAPFVLTDSSLTFSLSVSDGELSSEDTVTVFVFASDGVDPWFLFEDDFLLPASTGPTAVAGTDQQVTDGDLVRLDGGRSTGADVLSYQWTQTSGPPVVLSGVQTRIATFIASAVSAASVQLEFSLTVSDSFSSDVDTVMVIVGRAISPTNLCLGDADGDGVFDCQDACPADAAKTTPGICGCGQADTDSDGDGVADCVDQCPGAPDADGDGDGVLNCLDGCPNDPNKTDALVCGCGISDTDLNGNGIMDCNESCPPGTDGDADGDGVQDCVDGCPNDATKTAAGVCGCGVSDGDSDNDGVPDCNDQCPGAPDVDGDGDGVLNCNDGCPSDASKTAPGICGCGSPDADTDGDGSLNCEDGCPNDAGKTDPGICGCGVPDTDADGNGIADCNESSGSTQLAESFDGYAPGADPANWFDTGAGNSLAQNDSLFKTTSVDGDPAFGTSSTLTNIHSHYVAPGSSSSGSMTYTGRMRLSITGGGVGVTFMSDYPNRDAYYRLRSHSGNSFHIAPHGTGIRGGTTDSGVAPTANVWYSFHIEVDDTGTRTEIRANVWPAGSTEPTSWQINCYDDSASRLTTGTVGVWSMATGSKDWDDLTVHFLDCDADSDGDGILDCEDVCPNTADPTQTDTDGDGLGDACDLCPSDANKTSPGTCGCGGADTDGDGVCDSTDGCPNDANKTAPGVCGCGVSDADSDGDGTLDCADGCPSDPNKIAAGLCGCNRSDADANGNGIPDGCEAETTNSISQWGITWTFDGQYEFGQFVNGDFWVIGPVGITSISPAPSGGLNGSMINPMPVNDQAYDSRAHQYNEAIGVNPPFSLQPNQSLVSTTSKLDRTSGNDPHLQTAAVLTCLASPPADGSFRPPYCGSSKPMYDASLLDPGGLPRLVPVANMPSMAQAERWLERVWLDHKPGWTARFIHPAENMPEYGREIATQIGDVSLLLLVDVPNKETLLIRFVQLGIDLYGIVDNGGSWPADGGHGSGRKWPILFAGLMLNNSAMLNIGSTTVRFGEDQQTFYVSQNDVNVTNGPTWNPDERRGPAEPYTTGDIGMPEWGIRHAQSNTWDNKAWNAIYRECCTANAWVGFVLSARILGMQSAWNHDALFDYQDRYMDVSQSWRSWSAFSARMWDTYRSDY